MDFLKTLLIYMSMTFAMGVQQAEAPDPAALPTATPPAVVAEATADVVIATPAPVETVKPSNAAPTMTPNNKYTKVTYGDRSNNVKKLQQRLIALGYLAKGADDGAFGYKTLNAVRAFQKANGLSVDGVAGKATLTHLYEDPDVVAAPSAAPTATPTAKPTATAKTSAVVQAAAQFSSTEAPVSDLTVTWRKTDANVLLGGNTLVLLERANGVTRQRKPAVYLHDGKVMMSLNDMSAASGEWTLTFKDGSGCKLEIAGYEITLTSARGTTGDSDSFTAVVDGTAVALEDGDVVYAGGVWYCGTSLLENAVKASVVWDSDENTLVLRVVDKGLAQSVD